MKPKKEDKCTADVSVTVKFEDDGGVLESRVSISAGTALPELLRKIVVENGHVHY